MRGNGVAVSHVFADGGDLKVGDAFAVRIADTLPATLRVVAIYDPAAGLGDVLLDRSVARRHAAVRADGVLSSPVARRPSGRSRDTRPPARALRRSSDARI